MIHLDNLSFGYERNPLFSNLSLSIPAGRICGLLGKNGVGKTTLLKLISGLRFAQSGECLVMDSRSAARPPKLLQELFFLPEEFMLPSISVKEYERMFSPFFPRFDPQRFSQYMQGFELDPAENLHAFSFGQKKKFILAFGLATDCLLMLLDEPTNGLDIPSKSQFRRILAAEISDNRLFIIATHQARDLENIIDSVIILDSGDVIFNHSLEVVATRLSVHFQPEPPDDDTALHIEKVPGGYSVVTENVEGEETLIDLEILFNTVVSNRNTTCKLFEQEDANESH